MGEAKLNTSDLAKLVKELLAERGSLSFRARGLSMYPTIKHGETIVVQPVKPTRLRAGMVVLFRSPADGLITHRIVGFASPGDRWCVILRGDAVAGHVDVVPVDQVLAEVVRVKRPRRSVELAKGFHRFAGVAWARVPRLARMCLWLSRIIGSISSRNAAMPTSAQRDALPLIPPLNR